MAQPSATLQQNAAFFHGLGRTLTVEGQYIYESQYASSHVMFGKDILASTIPYCATTVEADAFVAANPSVVKKYTQYTLTVVPNTNSQAWYISDNGTWVKPILNEILTADATTNAPSIGFMPILYSSTGTQVSPGTGVWWVDAFSGMVRFGVGYTPTDLAIGTPKLTCYAYTGQMLSDVLTSVSSTEYLYDSTLLGISGVTTSHVITHNLGSIFLDATVYVQDPISGWEEQTAHITSTDANHCTLDLCFAAHAKVLLRKKI